GPKTGDPMTRAGSSPSCTTPPGGPATSMSSMRPRSGVSHRRSSTCPSQWPCRSGVTGRGSRRTVTADDLRRAGDQGEDGRARESWGVIGRKQAPEPGPLTRDVTPFRHPSCMANASLRDGPRPETVSRSTAALVSKVTQHHRAVSAHQRQLLSAVAELDRRKAWRIDGATTMVAWLVQRCSVTASTARDWVSVAEKLASLPKISESLSQGKLSFDQIKPLVQVAKPDTDARLAEAATKWSAKQAREIAVA